MWITPYCRICTDCGCEFKSTTPDDLCEDCKREKAIKAKRFKGVNANIMEDCRHADKLGLSYGEYKAGEQVWLRRYKLRIMEEQKR